MALSRKLYQRGRQRFLRPLGPALRRSLAFLGSISELFKVVDFVPPALIAWQSTVPHRRTERSNFGRATRSFLLLGIKLDRARGDGTTELEIGADDPIKCVDPKLEKSFALAAVHRFPMFGHQVAGLAIVMANVLFSSSES